MLQTVSRLLPELPLILMTAVATHLVMSFAQTLMHYKLGHHPMGGKFFRNHINFHHAHYSKDHLVSRTYLGDEGNNTPFFFIPVFLVGACTYLVLPVDLFVAQLVACAASFYAHVFFDKEYHIEGSRLQRFAWFRRKQELHFVHHRHANSNFAVIHFFWDRILGTYRRPDAGQLRRMEPFELRCPSSREGVTVRVDDAMHATRAAVEEGVLPGGGVALLRAIKALEKLRVHNDDQRTGIEIVKKAISWPARQIAINAGEDGSIVVGKILEKDTYAYGYDAQAGEYGNLVTKGIIDPTKVVRAALQGAASIAGLLITTEAMVAEVPKKQSPAMPGGGGMGGMDF